MIKKSIHQKYIKILKMYAPDHRASKYMEENLIKLKG